MTRITHSSEACDGATGLIILQGPGIQRSVSPFRQTGTARGSRTRGNLRSNFQGFPDGQSDILRDGQAPQPFSDASIKRQKCR